MKLAVAATIIDAALAEGAQRNFRPLTAVVLDAGGHLVVLKRGDGANLLATKIATGKAWGALGMGFGGRELERHAARRPQFYNSLIEMSGGNIVTLPGSALIRNADGELLGAVGVTGDTGNNDELCAVAGVKAAGLIPDTGDPLPA
jgi:uncharacterized protein GlcG (DUF336 family)